MPIYNYKHPETGEVFEDIRSFDDMEKPYISEDGIECEYITWYNAPNASEHARKHSKGMIDKNCEVWEKDRAYVKKLNPKYVRTRNGKKIKYNPNSMG